MSGKRLLENYKQYTSVSSDNREMYSFILQNKEDNDFLEAMFDTIGKKGGLSDNQTKGVINSMKYQENLILREQKVELHKNDEPKGSYVGTLKTRYDMVLKFISVKDTSRGFYIQNFLDKSGNHLISFSDNKSIVIDDPSVQFVEIREGDCFTCRATVNRHSINNFNPENKFKQTIINRVKYNKYLGNKTG